MNQIAGQISLFDAYELGVKPDAELSRFELSLQSNTVGTAWQYLVRERYSKEERKNPYWEEYELQVNKSIVKEISYAEAKSVIEKYEWLGCMPVCVRHCYGLFFPHKTVKVGCLAG